MEAMSQTVRSIHDFGCGPTKRARSFHSDSEQSPGSFRRLRVECCFRFVAQGTCVRGPSWGNCARPPKLLRRIIGSGPQSRLHSTCIRTEDQAASSLQGRWSRYMLVLYHVCLPLELVVSMGF
jgi:hypothetical protein